MSRFKAVLVISLTLIVGFQGYLRGEFWVRYFAFETGGQAFGLQQAIMRGMNKTGIPLPKFIAEIRSADDQTQVRRFCLPREFENLDYMNLGCAAVFGGKTDLCPHAAINTSCRVLRIAEDIWSVEELRSTITRVLREPCTFLPDPKRDSAEIEVAMRLYADVHWGSEYLARKKLEDGWRSAGCIKWPLRMVVFEIVDVGANRLPIGQEIEVIRIETVSL